MKIAYIDDNGKVVQTNGRLFTGIKDCSGCPIFEGDRVSVYIPTLDESRDGTVVFDTDDGTHPSWLVKLDQPYRHEHLLSELHGIPSYDTEYHYLDSGYTGVISPFPPAAERCRSLD